MVSFAGLKSLLEPALAALATGAPEGIPLRMTVDEVDGCCSWWEEEEDFLLRTTDPELQGRKKSFEEFVFFRAALPDGNGLPFSSRPAEVMLRVDGGGRRERGRAR